MSEVKSLSSGNSSQVSMKFNNSNVKAVKGDIWWSNAIFFIGMHIMALVGCNYLSPWSTLQSKTLWLCITSWQLATFGITIGYHRLWSHRAFTASLGLRIVLAGMGCLGFQGSIKWWVLRHRLHHRFTDSDSDPYNANEGLYHSHVGWIFRKPNYPRMALIDRKDLEIDPVVRFQHKYYLPLTLGLGLIAPTFIGAIWGDAMGGYVWGGVMARILIWHGTFCINSLAHYVGEQAYSEELSARSNFILALFTGGEANHNYHHAFPKDYRNGPRNSDWDPTKWAIYILHHFTPFVPNMYQTPVAEIEKAKSHVLALQQLRSTATLDSTLSHSSHSHHSHSHSHHSPPAMTGNSSSSFAMWSSFAVAGGSEKPESGLDEDDSSSGVDDSTASWSSSTSVTSDEDEVETAITSKSEETISIRRRSKKISSLPIWNASELNLKILEFNQVRKGNGLKKSVFILLEDYLVDIGEYGKDHPGGMGLLMKYSIKDNNNGGNSSSEIMDSTEAFKGGLNDHGWSAVQKMKELRVARFRK